MASSKKKTDNRKLIKFDQTYKVDEALDVLLSAKPAKFDETVELHLNLGVDGRRADQQIRGVIILPNGTGKTKKVLALVNSSNEEVAKKAGADFIGGEDMVNKIKSGWLDFDVCVTTPDMMPKIGKVAKILGPKGLMPNPKSGTITTDIEKAISEIKAGKVEYRLDKTNNMHLIIGKRSFGAEKLLENFNALMSEIVKAKPASAKGTFFKSITLTTTMGPGLRLEYSTK